MPRPSDAKSRFVISAAELFQRKGYSAVGLTEIIEAAQAPKGSFYHHFPEGKEQLAAQSVELAGAYVLHHFQKSFADAPDFVSGVEIMARTILHWLDRSEWEVGCPIVSISVDQVPHSTLLTSTSKAVLESWIDGIEAHAIRFGLPDPRGVALRLLIAYQGAWIVARIQRSPEPLLQLASMFKT